MFDFLLKNNFSKNIDIINATNKILVDRIPKRVAYMSYLLNKDNRFEVDRILSIIASLENKSITSLSMKKKKVYIKELNAVIDNQMRNHLSA